MDAVQEKQEKQKEQTYHTGLPKLDEFLAGIITFLAQVPPEEVSVSVHAAIHTLLAETSRGNGVVSLGILEVNKYMLMQQMHITTLDRGAKDAEKTEDANV